ncbi:MAG: hypothetical protein GY859_14660 [Desulfobacterales bacterium]|nr:hypothetical protein [Desulfobacterales bacterium]
MQASTNGRLRLPSPALIILPVVVLFLLGCQDQEEPGPPPPDPVGFSFLSTGAETPFSDGLRSRLEKTLGPDGFTRRDTIDLEIKSRLLLKNHFAALHAINTALNQPPEERIEHDMLKLTYRHGRRTESPFKYVELIFSGRTKLPLYFRIVPGEEAQPIIDQLRGKYGAPKTIDLGEKDSRLLFWTREKDVMIASILRNRYGGFDYTIMICFVESLENLIKEEARIARQKEEEKRKAGKTAF